MFFSRYLKKFSFFMFSPLEQFDLFLIFGFIQMPSVLLPLAFITFFIFVYMFFFQKQFFFLPKMWQSFFELIFFFVLNIIKQQAGIKALRFMPLIFNFFVFILFCNFLSLTPLAVALTSQIVLIFLITFTLCSTVFLLGLYVQGVYFLKLFVPTSPLLLLFLLIPIEIFSYGIRALSMAIRLSANIIAGHTLVFIISSFLLLVFVFNFLIFFFSWISILAVLALEFGVAFLQAYVFTVLFCIYIHDSLYIVSH